MQSYSDFVALRFRQMRSPTEAILHAAVGISGEAGELLDCVKKHWAYEQPLNLANAIEELGDIEFYLEAMRQCLMLDRDAIIQANIEKLSKRYPTGYTNEAAQARADKTSSFHGGEINIHNIPKEPR